MRALRVLACAFVTCSAVTMVACQKKEARSPQESAAAGGTLARPLDTPTAIMTRTDTSAANVATGTRTKSCAASGASAMSCCSGGMPCMSGMHGMTGAAMMDSMQAHMRRSRHMSADQMAAMVPMHRQMVGDMLATMHNESQARNLPSNAGWNALADSVQRDLDRMPALNKKEIKLAMPADCARVTRLIRLHEAMMSAPAK